MNKKVRFTLEIEYQNDGLTDDVIRNSWKQYSNYEDFVADKENWDIMEYSKRLLDVVLSDDKLLVQYLKSRIMSEIEMLDYRTLKGLVKEHDLDELSVLREAIKKLNYVDKAFFEQVIDDGVLSENTYEISDSFKVISKEIIIEEVAPKNS